MLALTTTTTQTTEVKLKPALKRKLQTELRTYGELKAQLDVIEQAMKKHRATVESILIEAEEQSLSLEGVGKATLVFPVRSQLDKKLFVAQGGSLEQLANATVTRPGRPYCKISLAGEKETAVED